MNAKVQVSALVMLVTQPNGQTKTIDRLFVQSFVGKNLKQYDLFMPHTHPQSTKFDPFVYLQYYNAYTKQGKK